MCKVSFPKNYDFILRLRLIRKKWFYCLSIDSNICLPIPNISNKIPKASSRVGLGWVF